MCHRVGPLTRWVTLNKPDRNRSWTGTGTGPVPVFPTSPTWPKGQSVRVCSFIGKVHRPLIQSKFTSFCVSHGKYSVWPWHTSHDICEVALRNEVHDTVIYHGSSLEEDIAGNLISGKCVIPQELSVHHIDKWFSSHWVHKSTLVSLWFTIIINCPGQVESLVMCDILKFFYLLHSNQYCQVSTRWLRKHPIGHFTMYIAFGEYSKVTS